MDKPLDTRQIKFYSLDRITIFGIKNEGCDKSPTATWKVRDGFPRLEVRKNAVANAEYRDNVFLIKFTFDKLFNTLEQFQSILAKGEPDALTMSSFDKAWNVQANAPGEEITKTGSLKFELNEKGLVILSALDSNGIEFKFPMLAKSDYYKLYDRDSKEATVSKLNSHTTATSWLKTVESQMQFLLHKHVADNVYIKQ